MPNARPSQDPIDLRALLRGLAIVATVFTILGINLKAPVTSLFQNGWFGYPIVLAIAVIPSLARQPRTQQHPRRWALVCTATASLAFAAAAAHSGMPWQFGVDSWAWFSAPLLGIGIWMACEKLQRHVSTSLRVVGLVTLVILVGPGVLAAVANKNRELVVTRLSLGAPVTPTTSTPTSTPTMTSSPAVSTSSGLYFPAKDGLCQGDFSNSEIVPSNVPAAIWDGLRRRGRDEGEWKTCPVGEVRFGADGQYDQKVASHNTGPEGHIVARFAGAAVVTTFVPPIVGQAYFQQTGGEPLDWGIPNDPRPCGGGHQISIFVSHGGAVTGYALWSISPTPQSHSPMTAWFVSEQMGAGLLAILARNATLPLADGPPTDLGNGTEVQYFGLLSVTTPAPRGVPVTERALLAHC
jgi:hypothetical protein